jgi:tripartite-type tricarboxylate transporter receptor subunit TctC
LAQAAFQKLSEAFEQLSAAAPTAAAQAAAARPAKRKREKPWWDVPTWEEIWMELEWDGG